MVNAVEEILATLKEISPKAHTAGLRIHQELARLRETKSAGSKELSDARKVLAETCGATHAALYVERLSTAHLPVVKTSSQLVTHETRAKSRATIVRRPPEELTERVGRTALEKALD